MLYITLIVGVDLQYSSAKCDGQGGGGGGVTKYSII
jgi:hypothetical protein